NFGSNPFIAFLVSLREFPPAGAAGRRPRNITCRSGARRGLPALVIGLPPVAAKGIDAKLSHDMRKIDHDPVVDDLAIDHAPEVHVTDLDPLAGGGNPHELAAMGGFLPTKCSGPFAHEQARLVDTDLVLEGRLERLLPIVLE